MISAGRSVTDNSTPLSKVTLEYLYNSVRNPREEIASMLRQLRLVRQLDAKKYAAAKRQLPYVCCGVFNPPFHNSQNFAYTRHFIIDIDHLSAKGLDVAAVKSRLAQDTRVSLMFVSPSEDGLKVVFTLSERCMDAGLFSAFYRAFAQQFAAAYALEQVVDRCTSDVARACFVSHDPDAYYNPQPEEVLLSQYVDADNPCAFFATPSVSGSSPRAASVSAHETVVPPSTASPAPQPNDPDEEAMNRIKQILTGKEPKPVAEKPPVPVPQILNDVMPSITATLNDAGVALYEVVNIQYGKKMRMRLGTKLAELNVFYGKRGFSIVKSPRCGTSPELNDLVARLVALQLTT